METKQMPYAHVESGVITHRGGLPKNFENTSGFNLQTDAELKARGWLPLIEVGVALGEDETTDGEEVVIGSDDVTVTALKRSMTAAEIIARTKSEALSEINRLEELETPRRMAEAILSSDGKTWLTDNRAAIVVEREKL
jgi:hypothetical protein